ncbi:hypothetical protein C8R45DRAFT_1029892 [Mycena sanguinolenta]|nr:hypothetical protein C8R45DRAFT_1029892 [Mycena sanguinolenta]
MCCHAGFSLSFLSPPCRAGGLWLGIRGRLRQLQPNLSSFYALKGGRVLQPSTRSAIRQDWSPNSNFRVWSLKHRQPHSKALPLPFTRWPARAIYFWLGQRLRIRYVFFLPAEIRANAHARSIYAPSFAVRLDWPITSLCPLSPRDDRCLSSETRQEPLRPLRLFRGRRLGGFVDSLHAHLHAHGWICGFFSIRTSSPLFRSFALPCLCNNL